MNKRPKSLRELRIEGNVVLCFSGGIDSFVGKHYLEQEGYGFIPVYFDLKSRYSAKERYYIEKNFDEVTIDESLSWLGKYEEGDHAFVPQRNLLLASVSSIKYASNVLIAGIGGDEVEDKSESFFNKLSKMLSGISRRKIRVFSPFWHMTKSDIVRWYLDTGGDKVKLLSTVSCYSQDGENYCGRCRSCFRRACAFRVNGIELPFYNENLIKEYQEAALSNKYIKSRNADILKAFPVKENSEAKF